MSGSPPAENPAELSRGSRRRRRSEPHPVTTNGAVESILAPGPVSTAGERERQYAVSAQTPTLPGRPDIIQECLPSSRPPEYIGGVSAPAEAPYLQPGPATAAPGATAVATAARALPPRQTRRTKAHVASACVNCKRKHLGCDSARPCRRCVLAGKASTCVDVTHKKRGRPPLKAEEAPLRPYTSPFEDSTRESLQISPSSSRGHFHRRTSSREIRPITDLQFSRAGDPGRIGSGGLGPAVVQPPRWPPSMFSPPQTLATSPSMPGSLGPRPFSSSGVLQHALVTQAPSPYIQSSAGGLPTAPVSGGHNPVEISRQVPPYIGRSLPPTVSPQLYQQPYRAAPSPYIDRPRTPPTVTEPPVSRELQPPYFEPGIRLPPILPPTTTVAESVPVPSAHRRSDPFPTQWSFRERQGHLVEQRQPAPHEPREPVSHQPPPYQRFPPELVHLDVSPRQQPGPSVPAAQMHPSPESPVRAQAGQPRTAAEGDDSPRPAKRRRMALDDMVND
ncbi:hypothetical protein VTN00DRAFT_7544 [Thermoascus crustaceus]|uniref:uncharacterized protein n=1 Tax=Thermoascus crustaceus TaxID=5088 RepID=UPI0037437A6B